MTLTLVRQPVDACRRRSLRTPWTGSLASRSAAGSLRTRTIRGSEEKQRCQTFQSKHRKCQGNQCVMIDCCCFNMQFLSTPIGSLCTFNDFFLFFFFLGFPPPEAAEGHSPDRRHLVRKPILFALGSLGAAIVTNLVLKPHAEACCFGLFYGIVAKASLC